AVMNDDTPSAPGRATATCRTGTVAGVIRSFYPGKPRHRHRERPRRRSATTVSGIGLAQNRPPVRARTRRGALAFDWDALCWDASAKMQMRQVLLASDLPAGGVHNGRGRLPRI